MGCTLSHYRVWQKLAADSDPDAAYLILEDDAVLNDDWRERWAIASEHLPDDADVVYLGGVLPPNRGPLEMCAKKQTGGYATFGTNTMFSQNGTPTPFFHMCAYAYVMRRSGALKLMEWVQQNGLILVSDHMMCNNFKLLNLALLYPVVAKCYQDDDPKYNTANFNDYNRKEESDTDLWNNTESFSPEEVILDNSEDVVAPPAVSALPVVRLPIPPGLNDGMDVTEAYAIIRSHYSAAWDAYHMCRTLGMEYHAYLTACDALARGEFTYTTQAGLALLLHDLPNAIKSMQPAFLRELGIAAEKGLKASAASVTLHNSGMGLTIRKIIDVVATAQLLA